MIYWEMGRKRFRNIIYVDRIIYEEIPSKTDRWLDR